MFSRKTSRLAPSVARGVMPEEAAETLPEPQLLWAPPASPPRKSIEALLIEKGHLTREQSAQARRVSAQHPGKSITQSLLEINAVTEAQLLWATAQSLGIGFEQPAREQVAPAALALLTFDFIRKHGVIPLRFEDGRLVAGMSDPSNVFLLDEIRRQTQRPIQPVAVPLADIHRLLEQLATSVDTAQVDQIIRDVTADQSLAAADARAQKTELEEVGNESPIIRFVNYLITEAIKQGASDIHIEPKEKSLKIRHRIDGLLFETLSPPAAMQASITSRLKIMANLDISERRLPQDGRIRAEIDGRTVDLRLSTLPTASGEKCVLRILDDRTIGVSLNDLGMGDNALTIWKSQIDQPHGIVLVTGPTGSGKTTTLYASLRSMDANRLNISTVEDPIEYHLPAATQVQVHEKIGMTFAAALRALLRQDPDVVMVGEIRDQDTASMAVQAALTGHLVLSTLHTNDAPSSITRLINVGVEPYLISSAVNAIIAQRLVRKICDNCREAFTPTPQMQEFLMMQGFTAEQCFRGAGCERCRKTGYSGRLGIYELLVMDDSLRDLVTRNPDVNHLRRLCRERGLVSLREDGFTKVMKGLTTAEEILRVTENGS